MEDVPEHIIFILSAASKGSEPRDHLIENDAVAPPVCSLAVLTACLNLKHFLILKILHKTVSYIREYHQNLRSHVVRSATEGCGHVRSWKVFLAHSKVSNFHVALSVQEYVVKLEIPTLICIYVIIYSRYINSKVFMILEFLGLISFNFGTYLTLT